MLFTYDKYNNFNYYSDIINVPIVDVLSEDKTNNFYKHMNSIFNIDNLLEEKLLYIKTLEYNLSILNPMEGIMESCSFFLTRNITVNIFKLSFAKTIIRPLFPHYRIDKFISDDTLNDFVDLIFMDLIFIKDVELKYATIRNVEGDKEIRIYIPSCAYEIYNKIPEDKCLIVVNE